jgi:hypothetical protein
MVSMTYPNGRVLNYNYNTGVDNAISQFVLSGKVPLIWKQEAIPEMGRSWKLFASWATVLTRETVGDFVLGEHLHDIRSLASSVAFLQQSVFERR